MDGRAAAGSSIQIHIFVTAIFMDIITMVSTAAAVGTHYFQVKRWSVKMDA